VKCFFTAIEIPSIENGFEDFYPQTCTVLNRQYNSTQLKMSDTEQKPKRVMTEEQKAKMKAGREAAKARKDAEKVAAAPVAEGEAAPAPAEEAPKKEKKARKPKAPKDEAPAAGGAGAEEAPVSETPKKEKKEKKVPAAPKKEKVEETAPENKTTWQPIIALVFNLKNDNYEDDGSAGEEWLQDRTYFANEDALRRYLTDRINNWKDDFSMMIRAVADDSPTQIAKYIDHIVGTPFLTNHPLCPEFNVCRFSAAIHQ
jgi:hypothetical protein